jgi:hypothetical protein
VAATKVKALCVATRSTTVEQFVAMFHRFCDEKSFFVATLHMRAVGLETPFAIQLANRTPVLRGTCVVLDAWPTGANQFKRPGIRLGFLRLTSDSQSVLEKLLAARTHGTTEPVTNEVPTETPVPVPLPAMPSTRTAMPPIPNAALRRATTTSGMTITVPPRTPTLEVPIEAAKPVEERTPGSDLILPANPLQNLTDESLEGFVDCTLYEETGNFFRASDDGSEEDEPAAAPQAFKPLAVVTEPLPEVWSAPIEVRTPIEIAAPPVVAAPVVEVAPQPRKSRPTSIPPPTTLEAMATPTATHTPLEVPITPIAAHRSRPVSWFPPPEVRAVAEASVSRLTPMPAGEVITPAPRKQRFGTVRTFGAVDRRWWIAGGAAAFVSVVAIIVIASSGSSDATTDVAARPADAKTPAPAKAAPPAAHAATPPPGSAKPAAVTTNELADPGDPSVIGDGPCKLDVKTMPAGSMVVFDGRTVGSSPLTLAGTCDNHQLEFTHPRYKTEKRTVALASDKPGKVDVTLVRPTHSLRVFTSPPGANVYIAGTPAGTSPTVVQINGFTGLDVKVERAGYAPVNTHIYSKTADDKLVVNMQRKR